MFDNFGFVFRVWGIRFRKFGLKIQGVWGFFGT